MSDQGRGDSNSGARKSRGEENRLAKWNGFGGAKGRGASRVDSQPLEVSTLLRNSLVFNAASFSLSVGF